jgi:hypothetical protein
VAEIDAFATSLLEESKRFFEKASVERDLAAKNAYLHSAQLLGFCSLEAHINAIAEDFINRPELSAHERGILLEKEVHLYGGEFVLGGLRMCRMEDRISFLHTRFSGARIDKTKSWWAELACAIDLRNKLSHPKQAQAITTMSIERALKSIVDSIDALYLAIYKRKFPAATMGLQSRMDFGRSSDA